MNKYTHTLKRINKQAQVKKTTTGNKRVCGVGWWGWVYMIRLKQNGVLILFGCGDTFKTKWGLDFVWLQRDI